MTAPNDPQRPHRSDPRPPPDSLSSAEIRKDSVQDAAEAVAGTVGEVATIITRAVQDVVKSVGGLATELFEIRDSARKATTEHVAEDGDAAADEAVGADDAVGGDEAAPKS